MDNELYHYGMPRRSGRYPWGSGEDPYQHEGGLNGYLKELKDAGFSEDEMVKSGFITTTQLRAAKSIAKKEKMAEQAREIQKLIDAGYSNVAIGERLGMSEGNVRAMRKKLEAYKQNTLNVTCDALKDSLNTHEYIQIGPGVEAEMNVSRYNLDTAIEMLKQEGYTIHNIAVDQGAVGQKTQVRVLAKPGVEWKEVVNNTDKIGTITECVGDDGLTLLGIKPPVSLSSTRVRVKYAEEGGVDKDGVIELRRGLEDISLGKNNYAQVRIAVDGTHYLKGMAVYSDNLPDGVDVLFNTNKHVGTPMLGEDKDNTVLKPMKSDPSNPFGATIKPNGQRTYLDSDGKEKQSVINIVNEEGDWDSWTKAVASQFLSKQPVKLAKKQLAKTLGEKEEEFEDIMSLTNDTVKKQLLMEFADGCDSAAVHLKAAALPRQGSHVILPVPSLKDGEIYAPNYENGEEVILVRYPHGGIFEIPRLKVNNRNKEAQAAIGKQAKDAVGINSTAAAQLSGADFDGDSVLVIPTKGLDLKSSAPLEGLKGFDPKEAYPGYEGMTRLSGSNKGNEMGKITNLITDMTIAGATEEELTRAVKHSMVIIDAEKHNLNYKLSYRDNGIAELNEKYRGSKTAGAATLISRASAPAYVNARKIGTDPVTGKRTGINSKTGEKIWEDTGETYFKPVRDKKTGEVKSWKEVAKTFESTQMAETNDAYSLSSGYEIENVYASHANSLKNLANQARLAYLNTDGIKYSPTAAKTYSKEVASLNEKLVTAKKNAPKERMALIITANVMKAIKKDNPELSNDDLKKKRGQALTAARAKVGAKKERVTFSSKEWEAVQAGAISKSKLSELLRNADMDEVKSLAMPRTESVISSGKIARAKTLLKAGYTQAEVADELGVSVYSLKKYVL